MSCVERNNPRSPTSRQSCKPCRKTSTLKRMNWRGKKNNNFSSLFTHAQYKPRSRPSVQPPPPTSCPDIFKLVHYEARMVGKWTVGILLEYFLVHNTNTVSIEHSQSATPTKRTFVLQKFKKEIEN